MALALLTALLALDALLSDRGAVGQRTGPQPRPDVAQGLVFVDGANGGAKDGSPEHPWPTIAEGLAAAEPGDQVFVAEGLYAENLLIGMPITLAGGFASYTSPISWTQNSALQVTIIDGRSLGTVISVTRDITATAGAVTISGFTITGGAAPRGGGLYAEGTAVNLEDDRFIDNRAIGPSPFGLGGAIYALDGALAITITHIISNTASQWGGGIYALNSGLAISSTQVLSNTAGQGGGGVAVLYGPAEVVSSTIATNRAGWWGGGGVYISESPAHIDDTHVLSNTAVCCGGGISALRTSLSLKHSRIDHNSVDPASYYGGGIYAENSDATLEANQVTANSAWGAAGLLALSGRYTLTNNYIARNVGGGIVLQSGDIRNNTLRDNRPNDHGDYGWAIGLAPPPTGQSFVTITNNIVVSSALGITSFSEAIVALLSHNDVWNHSVASYSGLIPGPGDIAADPLLDGDYALLSGSPCIDAGAQEGAPAADIELRSRPRDGDGDNRAVVDIGAYEYGPVSPTPTGPLYLPLIFLE